MSYILLHSRLLKLRFRCPLQRIFFWFLIENKQVQQLLQKLLLWSIGEESLDKQNCYLDILSKNRCNYEDLLWIFRVLGMSRCRSRLHMPAQKQTNKKVYSFSLLWKPITRKNMTPPTHRMWKITLTVASMPLKLPRRKRIDRANQKFVLNPNPIPKMILNTNQTSLVDVNCWVI